MLATANQARDSRNWSIAATFYGRYLQANPGKAAIWVQFGHSLKESGRHDEAERAYKQSLSLAPRSADTHLQLGHLLKITGRFTEALESYTRAATLDPWCPDAAWEVGNLQAHHADEFSEQTEIQAQLRELADRLHAIEQQNAYLLFQTRTSAASPDAAGQGCNRRHAVNAARLRSHGAVRTIKTLDHWNGLEIGAGATVNFTSRAERIWVQMLAHRAGGSASVRVNGRIEGEIDLYAPKEIPVLLPVDLPSGSAIVHIARGQQRHPNAQDEQCILLSVDESVPEETECA